MAYDPELIAETRAWFVKAANDFRAAQALTAMSPPLLDEAVFHCQQAAEKVLKGFLTWHGRPFRRTHNLEEIGEQCLKIDSTLGQAIDQVTPLTEYAWRFRYPGEPEQPTGQEAAEALSTARLVYESVMTRVPPVVQP